MVDLFAHQESLVSRMFASIEYRVRDEKREMKKGRHVEGKRVPRKRDRRR